MAEEHSLVLRTINNRCFCVLDMCEWAQKPHQLLPCVKRRSSVIVDVNQLTEHFITLAFVWKHHNTTDCFNGAPCVWVTKLQVKRIIKQSVVCVTSLIHFLNKTWVLHVLSELQLRGGYLKEHADFSGLIHRIPQSWISPHIPFSSPCVP